MREPAPRARETVGTGGPAEAPGSGPGTAFERLSALDALFLALEDDRDLMHIGLVVILEKGALRTPEGRIDRDRIRTHARTALCSLPKFRKRLVRVPLLRHPVLVDDDRLDLDFHLRFLTLERATNEELQALIGRIYSETLDRSRPLWELWVIDGLPGDEVAIVMKTHHCLVDGVAGVAVFMSLLSATPEAPPAPGSDWEARPAPPPRELLREELRHLRGSLRHAIRGSGAGIGERARALAKGLGYVASTILPPVTRSSLNPRRVGTTRSFAWAEMDLPRVKAVKSAAGVKLNDVVLATVAGAMHRFLGRRGEDPPHMTFRAVCPVSTHELGAGNLENDVSFLVVPLPLSEPDPGRRLELVSSTMLTAKSSGEVQAVTLVERFADLVSFGVVSAAIRAVPYLRAYNMIVTNVPGPDIPLYFLGAEVRAVYPLVPLFGDNTLGVALLSYGGKLFWGFNADRERVPDLDHLVDDVHAAFAELETSVFAGRSGEKGR